MLFVYFKLFTFFSIFIYCSCYDHSKSVNEINKSLKETRYLLYDVNPPEGFNLRRDVYMRIAILMKHLQDLKQPWKLVLPPWGNMYHWQSKDVGDQSQLPWGLFFDVKSMQKFIPVIEMHEFIKEFGGLQLDQVFFLQHFNSDWVEGKWEEKMSVEECHAELPYREAQEGVFKGWFWGYRNISALSVKCLSFQGHATSLIPLLINATDHAMRTVVIDRAEVALHHMFGDSSYWQVRRSMRFAFHLRKIATKFRGKYLNSTDKDDNTVRPSNWQLETKLDTSEKRGGNYLGVHLRRKDFVWGRSKQVPSIMGAAAQISKVAKKYKFNSIFVATDATKEEIKELKSLLQPLNILLFKPKSSQRQELMDGGSAIVEQIICSHARVFYGTHESTFSFRIQEEREIMGFDPETTFNRLCGDDEEDCTRPTRWRIEY